MVRQVAGRLNPLAIVQTDKFKAAEPKVDAAAKALVTRSAEIAIAASLTPPSHFTPGDLPAAVAEVSAIPAPGVEQPAAEAFVSPAPLVELPPTMPTAVADATSRLLESGARAAQTLAASQPFASTMESAMTTAEDFMAFGQGNFEAIMKSGQIWAAGVQDLGKHVAAGA